MKKEYTYDIGKYTIGVDKNSEDGIGLTVAIINDDGEIHLLGNCYGDNAMCIDLLIKENQQLKERYENLMCGYKFLNNRVKQGMSNENKNKCLIELGNQILREIEKSDK